MSSANRNLNLSMQRFRSSLTSVRKLVTAATLIAVTRSATNSPNAASFWKTLETECAGRESSSGPCVLKTSAQPTIRNSPALSVLGYGTRILKSARAAAEGVLFCRVHKTSAVRFTDFDLKWYYAPSDKIAGLFLIRPLRGRCLAVFSETSETAVLSDTPMPFATLTRPRRGFRIRYAVLAL